MTTYLESARSALKLERKGMSVQDIKAKLGLRYALEVYQRLHVARLEETFAEPALTQDEIRLLLSVAAAQRYGIERGDACSPKLKCCNHWSWSKSRAAYLAHKRLGTHRRGENERKSGTGLGLLDAYNGYVRLTRAGWALVHAIEAERKIGGAA